MAQELRLENQIDWVDELKVNPPVLFLTDQRVNPAVQGMADIATYVEESIIPLGDESGYRRTYRRIRQGRGQEMTYVPHYSSCANSGCYTKTLIEERLMEDDYTFLGGGHYSAVMLCPWDETKCIKIGMGPNYCGDYWEDGWLAWAGFCMTYQKEHGNIDFLPNIHDVQFHDGFFLALIDVYDDTLADYRYANPDMSYGAWQSMEENITAVMQCVSNYARCDKYASPKAKERIREVMNHELCPNLSDVHDENIMIDYKNACAVIIDPCSRDYHNGDTRRQIFIDLGIEV